MVKNFFCRKYLFLLAFVFMACQNKQADQSIARLGDEYIYTKDIEGILGEGVSKEDSLNIVKSYFDQWARQKLLYKQALKNISSEQLAELDKLVEQYKSDLLIKKYFENLIKSKIDTTITHRQMVDYYNVNKENFKTHQTLVQMRYIQIPKNHPNFDGVISRFQNFNKKESSYWKTTQLQLKSSALNDSVWIDLNQVFLKLPFLTTENVNSYISSQKSFTFEDSLDAYYVKINKVILPNQESPFEFLKPTIKEILINQRQQQFIKKFEKEIIQDAIKNNTYEVY
jgi:hypothetical protein